MTSAIGFVTVLILLAAAGLAALSNMDSSISEIRQNHESIHAAAVIQKAFLEMESGLRSYLRQPDERHLDMYRKGFKAAQDGLQRLKKSHPACRLGKND